MRVYSAKWLRQRMHDRWELRHHPERFSSALPYIISNFRELMDFEGTFGSQH